MYACASVYVFGCYVCIVSVFKKTFTGANVQHEEERNITSPIWYRMCSTFQETFETELSFDSYDLKNCKYSNQMTMEFSIGTVSLWVYGVAK